MHYRCQFTRIFSAIFCCFFTFWAAENNSHLHIKGNVINRFDLWQKSFYLLMSRKRWAHVSGIVRFHLAALVSLDTRTNFANRWRISENSNSTNQIWFVPRDNWLMKFQSTNWRGEKIAKTNTLKEFFFCQFLLLFFDYKNGKWVEHKANVKQAKYGGNNKDWTFSAPAKSLWRNGIH